MLCLYVQAPFAVFRTFTAGSFRPTSPFITPSAAYGLLLNLAGIEMREDDGKTAMTLIRRTSLPRVEIALGALRYSHQHSLYQQLHNYPVGTSGKERKPLTKGNKYNIVPARRAFLSDLRTYVCLRGDEPLADQIRLGLAGKGPKRYGLPFLGDSNFLPDRIEEKAQLEPAHWFVPVQENEEADTSQAITRLTITIDRADMSRTTSRLFRPEASASTTIPEAAWVMVDYS
ncbi:MAG: type I-MYXAN CRISPR-associated protein Cas5/Cmx5/DevS [Gammaproteobacteria bacterium]